MEVHTGGGSMLESLEYSTLGALGSLKREEGMVSREVWW